MPLDPVYPSERLAFQLQDAQVHMLLTQEELRERWSELTVPQLYLDREWERIGQEEDKNIVSRVEAEHLAYVIYTSGSTGRPKGVSLVHRNTVALIRWALDCFDITHLRGVLAGTSICFDLSVFELFVPLCCGGTVYLAETGLHLPTGAMREQITLLNTVPSVISELLRSSDLPSSVRVVNLAGEPLQRGLVQQLYQLPTIERVYNLYGPTEDTTYSTWALLEREDQTVIPIGRPIANTQAYILDQWLEPVPIGVTGELYLAGAGVARGYLQQPELTAQRFLPNPFSREPGARFYRTGDLARYLPDGNIAFLGRADHQIKLRGYRIELGEIEAVLVQHPAVQEAVVLAREDEPGNKRLVAYVVPIPGASVTSLTLRQALHEHLPSYMVPAVLILLTTLPLTPNGKIDRQALPVPQWSHFELEESYEAPHTPTEDVLSRIWATTLHLERVGRHDNFFHLGGHSLLAAQIMSRIRETFQVAIPMRVLFERPDVAHLAQQVEIGRQKLGADHLNIPPLVPQARNEHLPLSFAQERLWFLNQLEQGGATYNTPMVLRLRGDLDVHALERGLEEIVHRHEILRTTFPMRDGRPMQCIASQRIRWLPVIDLSELPNEQREDELIRQAQTEAVRLFTLEQGLLLRASLLRCGSHDHMLLVNMHHIITDGWSQTVFLHELTQLYEAFSAERPSPLPKLRVQYADYALWQRQWLQGEVLEQQLAYWRNQLAGAPAVLELPTDHTRPVAQSYQGARIPFVLSSQLSQQLHALSQQESVTLYMMLLAAFQVLLWRYTGRVDIVVGTPIAGRSQTEVEELIGFRQYAGDTH